ncbi:GFA family protein [Providencia huaxiensis]|uniref:GFA family protein n=1 Tax=Providencia huaxiensis TaxID=2027290 RepID=UPI001E5C6334|nr:GFA family protein [Providencia huaxiensis]MCD2530010.1 GFA family protein [Providencia huaxiensis]
MHQGQCLCGSVKITTAKDISHVSVCHCGMCQKWNGGPGFSVDCGNDLIVEGQEAVTIFASSEWGERAFCKNCGSHLFYHLLSPSTYYVSATLFKESKDAQMSMQIYIDSKPQYYNFVERTPMLTEKDIMEMMSPSSD